MDDLFMQLRSKYSGAGQQKAEGSSSLRERRIPPQKSSTFKGDKKSQNWLQKQFSRRMSQSNGTGEDDYAAAVAAAAFAIFETAQMSSMPTGKSGILSSETPPTKAKSKKEKEATIKEPVTMPKPLPGEEPKTTTDVPLIQTRPTFAEHLSENMEDTKAQSARMKQDPSIKKASSFSDNRYKRTGSLKPESTPVKPKPKPEQFAPTRPRSAAIGPKAWSSSVPGGESKADAWEREEMAKIKERYDKVKSTIHTWEDEKKKKAKSKLDRKESEVERKRAKALQNFKSEMERITQIAGEARAQAEERRRNEELKVKGKANKIRSTGKLPATCFCF